MATKMTPNQVEKIILWRNLSKKSDSSVAQYLESCFDSYRIVVIRITRFCTIYHIIPIWKSGFVCDEIKRMKNNTLAFLCPKPFTEYWHVFQGQTISKFIIQVLSGNILCLLWSSIRILFSLKNDVKFQYKGSNWIL